MNIKEDLNQMRELTFHANLLRREIEKKQQVMQKFVRENNKDLTELQDTMLRIGVKLREIQEKVNDNPTLEE